MRGGVYLCNTYDMQLQLRQAFFWDTDVKTIDLQQHKTSVIERIVMRGRLEEFQAAMRYYGKETVKKVLLNARYLDKTTLAFCSTIFEIPVTEFRCYKLAQLNPGHWDY